MLLEFLIALLLGMIAGTITGLLPGIHINLVGSVLVSSSLFFLKFTDPVILVVFIVAMSITHTFIDFIPSVFLGAPDEDTILSVLPGHELLKKGRGYEAVYLSNIGSISAIFIIILITAIFILFLKRFEPLIQFLIPYILITSSGLIILKEKNKFLAQIVFLLSGFLGVAVLNLDLKEPSLPLLSGLFGASSLIISVKTKVKIPKQIITQPKISKKILFPPLIASAITAPLCSFIPGLGSGQAAIISSNIIRTTREKFLILLGATNTIVLGLSFVVLYIIGKTRTGVAVSVQKLLDISANDLYIIIITIITAGILSFFLTLLITKQFIKLIDKVNYSKLSLYTLIFLSIVVLVFSNISGFIVFTISTATGIYGILSGVKRINLIGCLILPVILIYI